VSPLVAFLMKVVFFLTGTRWSGTLSVQAVSDAIGSIVQNRFRDAQPNEAVVVVDVPDGADRPIAGGGGAPGDPHAPIVFMPGQVVPKVDVVLFQDCWMATLETAFELQDDVRYIVSSQSLVPAGFTPNARPGAVWPYEMLIAIFLNQENFAAPMMDELEAFFEGGGRPQGAPPDYNRYPATKVLFSLI